MHQIKLGGVGPSVSELALGCMRLCNLDTKAAESLLRTAMEQAAQAYPNVEMDIYTGDLEDGQAIVQQMPPNSYDLSLIHI